MNEVELKVLRHSWDRKVIDKIALIFIISCQIVDMIKTDIFSSPLQGIINEDWCFSLHSAGNSLQVGKIISYF